MSFDELAKEMDELLKSGKPKKLEPETIVTEEPKKVAVLITEKPKKKGLFSRLFNKKEKVVDIPEQVKTPIKEIPVAPVFEEKVVIKKEIKPKEIKSNKSVSPKQQLDERAQTLDKKEKLLNELTKLLETKKNSIAKEEKSLDKKKQDILKIQDKFKNVVPAPKVDSVNDKALVKRQKLLAKLEIVLEKKRFKLADEEHLLLQEKEKLKLIKNELAAKERTVNLQISDLGKKASAEMNVGQPNGRQSEQDLHLVEFRDQAPMWALLR